MRKEDSVKTRVCVQYDEHSRIMCSVLCSLMEHQSLVDLAIRCGNNTMHAHKCILAANSPYFREQLEKNPGTEQVIINGLDFMTMKSVIEFVYCGETNVPEEYLKNVVAAAKLFQIRGLQALASETKFDSENLPQIPPPIFINKKPKYSSPYVPYLPNALQLPQDFKVGQPIPANFKRMKLDEHLISDPEGIPLPIVNYSDMNPSILNIPNPNQVINFNTKCPTNMFPIEVSTMGSEKTVDKIKDVFCQEMQTNVEIMYKTPEGEFVKVTDEVLRKINGDTLQFQVIDENGHEGEIQLLDDKIKMKADEIWKQKGEKFNNNPYREFITAAYQEENNTDNVDLDSILMNFQAHSKNSQQNAEEIDKFNTIMADLNANGSNGEGKLSNEAGRLHRNDEVIVEDHTDILNEINSMQFYDKSVYEDSAERFESAFQSGYSSTKANEDYGLNRGLNNEVMKSSEVNLSLDGGIIEDKFF